MPHIVVRVTEAWVTVFPSVAPHDAREGDERCIVFDTSFMERGHSMFERDGNEPVMYASFAPSQMLFKFDFWEKGRDRDGDDEPFDGGTGPAGEMYMSKDELRKYLRWHARWSD